LNTRYTAM